MNRRLAARFVLVAILVLGTWSPGPMTDPGMAWNNSISGTPAPEAAS